MPRYYLPEDITCVARFQTRVPFANALNGVEATSLAFPAVLAAGSQFVSNRTQLVAALNDALPEGVTAAMHSDAVSVVVTHESDYTPPDYFGLWPRTTVYVVDQGGVPQCPFVGPVTGPQGGTSQTLAALLAAIDEAGDQAHYRATTGEDGGGLVMYNPEENIHERHDQPSAEGGEQHGQDYFREQTRVFCGIGNRCKNCTLAARDIWGFDEHQGQNGNDRTNACDKDRVSIGRAARCRDILGLTHPGRQVPSQPVPNRRHGHL